MRASGSASNLLQAVVINRAASDLDAITTFYVDGMLTNMTLSMDTDDLSKRCFMWTDATVEVCFTKRPDDATSTDFKVPL